MKAKDTVIKIVGGAKTKGLVENAIKRQAEISFKAGINEVVGWIESHDKSTCMDCSCAFAFRIDEWQAKVEKWGIE